MAVTAPTAPVPPTPPSVPSVVLGGGGSVTESTTPVSGYQSDADRQEVQARQAVARGDGALSKTTQERPQQSQEQASPAKEKEPTAAVQTDPQAAAAMQGDAEQPPEQSASTAVPSAPSSGTHGAGFWVGTIVAALVLGYALFRLLMKRGNSRGRLSFQDIHDAEPIEREADPLSSLRGLTPDEVLQQLAEDEAAEIRQARVDARERLRQAGRLPAMPEPPKAAVPKQAARHYRDQLTTMLPEKPPEKVVQRPVVKKEDEGHFEVRV